MAHDRDVAGIRCMEVLALLSDYVDGELEPRRRETVDAHLAGCDWCARFGGEVGGTVRQLRAKLGAPASIPTPVKARLSARLDRELEADDDGRSPPAG